MVGPNAIRVFFVGTSVAYAKPPQHVSASVRTARPRLRLVLSLDGHMPALTP
jgi:hypothetical protein